MMEECLVFPNRMAFREWLQENGARSRGVWLLFGKKGGAATLSAQEALEEALCFGWIDGQLQCLDSTHYKKYFAGRRENSKWSEKNKVLAAKLEAQDMMTEQGRARIAEAKENGQWDRCNQQMITPDQIDLLADLLRQHEPAFTNFHAMPPSVKRTYARAYYDARTDAGRESRLAWMVDRLNQNLKPM